MKIDNILHNGKAAIDNASSKKAINRALNNAETEVDSIPIFWWVSHSDISALEKSPWWPNVILGYRFGLKYFDENVWFECSISTGGLTWSYHEWSYGRDFIPYPSKITINSWRELMGDRVHDLDSYMSFSWELGLVPELPEHAFLDVIAKIDDTIIGYAVVEFYWEDNNIYKPRLLHSVGNSKIDGEYQAMDETEVKAEIETIRRIEE